MKEKTENTTLTLKLTTKEDLDKIKLHPRQSYDEAIKYIINFYREHKKQK